MKTTKILEFSVTLCAISGILSMSYGLPSAGFSLFGTGNLVAMLLFYRQRLMVTVYSNIFFFLLNLNGLVHSF